MGDEKNILQQNIEMWEKMTSTYMDSMFKAVEKTMEQSASFQKRINETVSTSVGAQLEATMAAMKAVERQLEVLTEKVNRLLEDDD
jgi:ubiquinone biosynthesis protein UbiJ